MAVITRDAGGRRVGARLRALTWSLAIIPLTAFCVALAIAFAGEWLYADRALPGVTVAGVDVGSLTRPAALDRLQAELARPWSEASVTATFAGRQWSTTNGALDVRPDLAAATAAALAYGKDGSLLDRLDAWADALRGDAVVPLAMRAEGDALDRWLGQIAGDVDRAPVAGMLAAGANGLQITNPIVGRQLDRTTTAASVLAARSLGDREIALEVRSLYPAVDESGFADALAKAQAITTPLVVSVEDRHVTEDAAGLATLLRIDRLIAKPGELEALPAGAIAPPVRYRYAVSIDEAKVAEWVKALGVRLDRPGVSAKYAVSKENTLSVIPGIAGIRLEQDKMTALMLEQLARPAPGVRELAAPSAADTTAFSTRQAQDWLPQLSRTSTFTTSFPVSASRHAIIATGSCT